MIVFTRPEDQNTEPLQPFTVVYDWFDPHGHRNPVAVRIDAVEWLAAVLAGLLAAADEYRPHIPELQPAPDADPLHTNPLDLAMEVFTPVAVFSGHIDPLNNVDTL
ncbi:hypothetical protein SRB5_53020 [Streptomyces sp. RB5]|uniref:Uncharacterized protein n=1 Tax=Streptomyces smaragdinus TaxID=2585196 RepID=A0A7K0CQU5_9ACTN|nr:hypothetical protein [Streptomyces smaragdinus]MQY15124.1 hypothetical protein [Streptomyces smaragdinus]